MGDGEEVERVQKLRVEIGRGLVEERIGAQEVGIGAC